MKSPWEEFKQIKQKLESPKVRQKDASEKSHSIKLFKDEEVSSHSSKNQFSNCEDQHEDDNELLNPDDIQIMRFKLRDLI